MARTLKDQHFLHGQDPGPKAKDPGPKAKAYYEQGWGKWWDRQGEFAATCVP